MVVKERLSAMIWSRKAGAGALNVSALRQNTEMCLIYSLCPVFSTALLYPSSFLHASSHLSMFGHCFP
jgi:hypothetical protein